MVRLSRLRFGRGLIAFAREYFARVSKSKFIGNWFIANAVGRSSALPGWLPSVDICAVVHVTAVRAAQCVRSEVNMDECENLNHTKWECKCRIVFIPKYRRKALFKKLLREHLVVLRHFSREYASFSTRSHFQSR